ncbi:MAG TPA: YggS family pyridoxal phosphate-dependent enzyme [Streptosporangiaceae bacterium]|nr:YggS family pyridoxal phosphate-dependent enzyme [Streptosporangiaceae bacterium]
MTSGSGSRVEAERRSEIAARLSAVRARIAAACRSVGRGSDEVTLIAVTKTRPVSDIRLLYELGVPDIGENKDQEAAPKAAESAALGLDLTWHFVGQLQTNKAASVVSYAQVIHSVDRLRLVGVLGSRARAAGRTVTCLVQVSLDGDTARGGAAEPHVAALADAVAGEDGLVLGGVMAVAPLGMPADAAFGKLRGVADEVRSAHPGAVTISAGMSDDLEPAIEAGATHVRVGTALLGGRSAFVR